MARARPSPDPDWIPLKGVKATCPQCKNAFASIDKAKFCANCVAVSRRRGSSLNEIPFPRSAAVRHAKDRIGD